jgi:hypothetical protein
MSELTKDRIQQIWDRCLIGSWDEKGNRKIFHVLYKFLCDVNPALIAKVNGEYAHSIHEQCEYMVSLNLKRCLDYKITKGKKEPFFGALKTDVIGFIHARCEQMSLDLIDGEFPPVVLMNIDSYHWKSIDAAASQVFRRKQRYAKVVENSTKTVKARSLDKKHDWKTVK